MTTTKTNSAVTIRPTDDDRWAVFIINAEGGESYLDRTYARIDSAVSKAWTLAKRERVPLQINVAACDCGRSAHAVD